MYIVCDKLFYLFYWIPSHILQKTLLSKSDTMLSTLYYYIYIYLYNLGNFVFLVIWFTYLISNILMLSWWINILNLNWIGSFCLLQTKVAPSRLISLSPAVLNMNSLYCRQKCFSNWNTNINIKPYHILFIMSNKCS